MKPAANHEFRAPAPAGIQPSARDAHIPSMGGSRKRPTQRRAQETTHCILEAAAAILEENGYRAASTNTIAHRAGVSIGSLYQYFASKDDVFTALLAEHKAEIHRGVADIVAGLAAGQASPAQALEAILHTMILIHSPRPRLMQAMETELAHLAEPWEGEQRAVEVIARAIPPAARRSPEDARASAWLATEITALVGRKLAHKPPAGLDMEKLQAAFSRAMRALLEQP